MIRHLLLFSWAVLLFFTAGSQSSRATVAEMDSLLERKDYTAAQRVLDQRLPQLLKTGDPDTVAAYLPYLGTVLSNTRNANYARKELLQFVQKAQGAFPYHSGLVSVFFTVADFFSRDGKDAEAYQLVSSLKKYFNGRESLISSSLSRIESNCGSYAMRMGNYGLASDHYRASLALMQHVKNPDLSEVFITNNSMGIVMWYSSKLDSCLFYFEKAIATLQQMEASPVNHHFRVAMLQNNVANVYNELGRKEEAIVNLEKAIQNYKLFIASPGADTRKKNALINQFQSVDNLAKTYQEVGDYSKSLHLFHYSYNEKRRNFGEESPEACKSIIRLGIQYYMQKDYAEAQAHLLRGLQLLKNFDDRKSIWAAEAHACLGSIMAAQGKIAEAAAYYEDAEKAYKSVLDEEFSAEYLQYLVTVSSFHAENGHAAQAISQARRALNYAAENQGRQSLLAFYHILNQANVNLKLKRYDEATRYSNEALTVLNQLISKSENLLDSVTLDMERPSVILVNAKAKYALLDSVNERSLRKVLDEVMAATAIIERKKASLTEAKDAAFLMANHKDLLDFTKQLQLQLFELTGNNSYLNQLIFLQESAIYNRIRSRLDRQKAMKFAKVPGTILSKEAALREAVTASLRSKRGTGDNMQAYLKAQKDWNDFQAQLRKDYPQYFNMRYAEKSDLDLSTLDAVIPGDMAVVRYVFIEKKLFALVMQAGKQNWVFLPTQDIEKSIAAFIDSSDQQLISLGTAYTLYQQLWQPVEKFISVKRVTVIPDGILHYLSFDMLAVKPPQTMRDWVDFSLLNRYAISYHYSLMALAPADRKSGGNGSFTAFAPGFSDNEKDSYRAARSNDTINLDNEYLNLIPLPFSISLSQKMQKQLGGDIFIGSNATHSAFRSKAGKHTIIQLGTHAEANNQFPQYSRLIFAKNLSNVNEDNSLYLNDIYDCDMSAELAVLTACETGRPGFFDGEGMISIAHAFHYAGSESMLTGLWKIDEQSSAIITEFFYRNLEKGQPKDVALQNAKLQYLREAEGRMISPRYWAGLVIMGDVSPVSISRKGGNAIYWAGAGLLLITAVIGYRKLGRRRK